MNSKINPCEKGTGQAISTFSLVVRYTVWLFFNHYKFIVADFGIESK